MNQRPGTASVFNRSFGGGRSFTGSSFLASNRSEAPQTNLANSKGLNESGGGGGLDQQFKKETGPARKGNNNASSWKNSGFSFSRMMKDQHKSGGNANVSASAGGRETKGKARHPALKSLNHFSPGFDSESSLQASEKENSSLEEVSTLTTTRQSRFRYEEIDGGYHHHQQQHRHDERENLEPNGSVNPFNSFGSGSYDQQGHILNDLREQLRSERLAHDKTKAELEIREKILQEKQQELDKYIRRQGEMDRRSNELSLSIEQAHERLREGHARTRLLEVQIAKLRQDLHEERKLFQDKIEKCNDTLRHFGICVAAERNTMNSEEKIGEKEEGDDDDGRITNDNNMATDN